MMRRMRLFEDLLDMQAETNRFFESVYQRLALFEMALSQWTVPDNRVFEQEIERRFVPLSGRGQALAVSNLPVAQDARPAALEMYDASQGVVAEIAIPGLEPGDLMISVNENRLTLQGKFSRTVELPPGTDGEQIRAQYRDGVLRISLPRPPAPSKTIPIDFQ
jgi:HSP20 family protein